MSKRYIRGGVLKKQRVGDVTPRYRAGGSFGMDLGTRYNRVSSRSNYKIGAVAQYGGKVTGRTFKPRSGKVAKKGHRKECEVHGRVEHPNVVRIAVTAVPLDDTLVSMWTSIIRFLMKRQYQVEYFDVDNIFAGGSGQLSLEYNVFDNKNTWVPLYTTVAYTGTDTLRNVGRYLARNDLTIRTNQITGTSRQPVIYPCRIRFGTATAPGLTSPWLRLDTMLVKFYGKAEVNLQNTTFSGTDTTSSGDTTRVNANPVTGNIVFGKGINPQVASPDISAVWNGTVQDWPYGYENDGTGVILSSVGATGNAWKAVQPPSQFQRATHAKSFILQPGEVKRFDFGYSWKGYFKTFIMNYAKGFTQNVSAAETVHQGADIQGSLNRWALIQVEKITQSDSVLSQTFASIQYQVDFHIGTCVLKGCAATKMNVDFGEAVKGAT